MCTLLFWTGVCFMFPLGTYQFAQVSHSGVASCQIFRPILSAIIWDNPTGDFEPNENMNTRHARISKDGWIPCI